MRGDDAPYGDAVRRAERTVRLGWTVIAGVSGLLCPGPDRRAGRPPGDRAGDGPRGGRHGLTRPAAPPVHRLRMSATRAPRSWG
ncbi:hypothetical protein ACPF8X_31405, partial [Streptomyces sp. G35A]